MTKAKQTKEHKATKSGWASTAPSQILYRSRYEQARYIERLGKGALTISRTLSHRFDFVVPDEEVRSTLSDASLVSLYGSRVPIKNGVI